MGSRQLEGRTTGEGRSRGSHICTNFYINIIIILHHNTYKYLRCPPEPPSLSGEGWGGKEKDRKRGAVDGWVWGSPYKGRWIGQNERPVGEDGAEGWGVGGEERMHQNSKKEQPPPTTTTTTVPTTSPSSSSSSSSSGTKARRTDGRTASESASTTRVGGVSPLFSLCFSLAGVWGETPPPSLP